MAETKKTVKPKVSDAAGREILRQVTLTNLNQSCTLISTHENDSIDSMSARAMAIIRHLRKVDDDSYKPCVDNLGE